MKRAGKPSRGHQRGRSPARPARAPFTLAEVAAAVGGALADAGNGTLRLTSVAPLDRAGPSDLSWVAGEQRLTEAAGSRAGALLVADRAHAGGRPAVVAANPMAAMAAWLGLWAPAVRPSAGVARGAFVHRTARLGRGVAVAAGATVAAGARIGDRTALWPGVFVGEGAAIGEDCLLYPNAAVLERCQVGNRCILYPGAVVGSDGFGYVWDGERHRKIPQIGIARLEDDVELGANATVDRATLGETVVRRGTKVDNLVMVAHNVEIGAHAIVCAQVGIAGSSRIGSGVTLAGQAGIADHAEVGDRAIVTAQGGVVTKARVEPGAVVSGMPAAPHREFLRSASFLRRLPELARRLETLERRLDAVEKGEPWSSESRKS